MVDFRWLVPFSRMVMNAPSPAGVHRALAEAAVAHLGAGGAAVLRADGDRVVGSAVAGLPAALATWSAARGGDVAARLLEQPGVPFAHARALELVAGGAPHGVLVLCAHHPIELDGDRGELDGDRGELAHAVVELAATAAARAEADASRQARARAEQLRLLGQLATGVSHQVKNLLNPVGLQLELLRRKLARGDLDGANQAIHAMAEAIHAGVGVVDRLRAFGRPLPASGLEPVDVAAAVRTAIARARPRAGPAIEIVDRVAPTAAILARAAELTRAVVELLANAIEAMTEHGGTVTVTCADAGPEVTIAVADTGPGMSAEAERRAFEPFFTTKDREGAGLGLAAIYAFVARHGGRIDLATAPGAGTTFTLRFRAVTAT